MKNSACLFIAMIAIGTMCSRCPADAQSGPASDPQPAATMAGDLKSIDPYPRGTWIASVYTDFAFQPGNRPERIASETAGIGYFFADHFSLSIQLTGAIGTQPVQDVVAYGGEFMLRNYFYNNKDYALFSDVGVGLLEANHRLPPGGTDFNFTTRTGLGIALHVSDQTDLTAGIRYLHLSNAHQEGPSRNPSINAGEVYVGFIFKL